MLYRRRLLAPDVSSSICAGICFGLSACSARCGMLISVTHGAAGMMGGVVLSVVLTSCGFVAQVSAHVPPPPHPPLVPTPSCHFSRVLAGRACAW